MDKFKKIKVNVTQTDLTYATILTALSYILPPLNAPEAIWAQGHGFPLTYAVTTIGVPWSFRIQGLVIDYLFWFVIVWWILRNVLTLKLPKNPKLISKA